MRVKGFKFRRGKFMCNLSNYDLREYGIKKQANMLINLPKICTSFVSIDISNVYYSKHLCMTGLEEKKGENWMGWDECKNMMNHGPKKL